MISLLSIYHAYDCSDLHGQCFEKQWSVSDFENLFNNPAISFFGMMQDNQLVGMIGLSFIVDQAEIYTICTHPDFQKQGIASRLLNYAKQEALDRLVTEIFLDVAKNNHAAIAFYTKHLFQQITIRKDYYKIGNKTIDAIMMRIDI